MGKRIQRVDIDKMNTKMLELGYQDENIHTQVQIDCSSVLWDYPDATAKMTVQAPNGEKYPVVPELTDNVVVWDVTDSDLVYAGSGKIQITLKNGTEVIKSASCSTRIMESITTTGPAPTPLENWMQRAEETAHQIALTAKDEVIEEIQDAAEAARESIPADYTQLSDDVTSLKSAISFGANNMCPKTAKGTSYPSTFTIVSDGDGTYTITGTASGGNVHYNLFSNQNAFPDGISAGDTILAYLKSTNPAIRMYIIWWVNGVKEEAYPDHVLTEGYKYFAIPTDATGFEIRFTMMNGTTTNGDIVVPYIFDSLTKYETEERLTENENDITTISDFMPKGYTPISVEPTAGLVNRWNEIIDPTGYAYIKQAVSVGEKYNISGWFYGGNFPAYLILNGATVLSWANADAVGAFTNLEIEIPANATHIVINGYTNNPARIAKWGMVKAEAGSKDSIVVGTNSEYTYNDINTAIEENPDAVIAVDYGTYDTEIKSLATDKTVIGKDRNLCVLTGENRDYETPPIETAGGIIKHFTVTMENASDASHSGYCLHSDTNACIGKTLIVEDCKFSCIGQHTVGLGIWQNENVIFKDCEFISSSADFMPIFAHNSGTSDGIAVMRFHNCIFRGTGYALKLSSYSSNCTIQLEFIDCTFESENYTGNDMIWTDYVAGDTHDQSNLHNFKGKLPLLKTSHGNNVPIANYSA